MKIHKIGNNLYIAQGFYKNRFFSANGINAKKALQAIFQAIAIYRSVIAWK